MPRIKQSAPLVHLDRVIFGCCGWGGGEAIGSNSDDDISCGKALGSENNNQQAMGVSELTGTAMVLVPHGAKPQMLPPPSPDADPTSSLLPSWPLLLHPVGLQRWEGNDAIDVNSRGYGANNATISPPCLPQ